MAEYVARYWKPYSDGYTARDRAGGCYHAYVPDLLAGWEPEIPAGLAADIAATELAIWELNRDPGGRHPPLDTIAHMLLRHEAMASSRIEAINPSPRRLLTAEAALSQGGRVPDRAAAKVLGNIAAMEAALDSTSAGALIGVPALLDVHARLMQPSRHPEFGGKLRQVQNWIGRTTPLYADFVPPPPENVPALVDDLVSYTNLEHHSPLLQAGIAHAQFETIHPFVDGNGRTGRALVHMVLRRRGLAPAFVPPISVALSRRPETYIAGLTAYRHLDPANSPARNRAVCEWLGVFTRAALDSCRVATRYRTAVHALEADMRRRVGAVRRDSAIDLLLGFLPARPVVTVRSAASLISRGTVTTGEAVNRLAEAGILTQRNLGKRRYRVFEARDAIRLVEDLDRVLTTDRRS